MIVGPPPCQNPQMSARPIIFGLALAIAAITLWRWADTDTPPRPAQPAISVPSDARGTASSASGSAEKRDAIQYDAKLTVEGAKPVTATPAASTARLNSALAPKFNAPVNKLSALMNEFRTTKDLAALAKKLDSMRYDAEALYLKAEILRLCATHVDDPFQAARRAALVPTPDKRAAFAAKLPKDGKDNELRLAAYDDLVLNRCGGLEVVKVSRGELEAAYKAAADAGDPVAKARALSCEMQAQMVADPKKITNDILPFPTMTEAQITQLKAILASGNPRVLEHAGQILASTYNNGVFTVAGESQRPLGPALWAATRLLACDLGQPCYAEDSNEFRHICAHEGKCAAMSHDEQEALYPTSGAQMHDVARLRVELRKMIDTGDFSGLTWRNSQPKNVEEGSGINFGLGCL
jgi:hypothetical protein